MSKLKPDERWKRFNEQLNDQMRANDFFGLGTTYYTMASFLEKEGKDPSAMRQKGYEMKLLFHKNQLNNAFSSDVVREVEVFSTPDGCELCFKTNGKMYSVTEALLTNPLPVEGCTHKYGCRCSYSLVIV